jgi:FXSXX-COOH protein
MDRTRDEHTSELVDLTGISLRALLGIHDSALDGALRRIDDELAKPAGAIAGWQSVITRPGDIPA